MTPSRIPSKTVIDLDATTSLIAAFPGHEVVVLASSIDLIAVPAGETYPAPLPRCPEKSQEGAQCLYEVGHEGEHFARDAFAPYTWETRA